MELKWVKMVLKVTEALVSPASTIAGLAAVELKMLLRAI